MAIKKDKLSEAQKAELERLRPFIARQGLVAQMNAAHWRAAIDAILGLTDYPSRYRLRCVRDTQDPSATAWSGPLPTGLPLYNFIEWLELNPVSATGQNFTAAITTALTAARIPHNQTPTGIRIIAYRRTKHS